MLVAGTADLQRKAGLLPEPPLPHAAEDHKPETVHALTLGLWWGPLIALPDFLVGHRRFRWSHLCA